MAGNAYLILGGNGVFGVHAAKYLLEHAEPRRVICVGRNPERGPAFTLNLGRAPDGKPDPRYLYKQIHVVFEQDRLLELLDREKPEVVINFAALAYATSWDKSWRYYDTNVVALAKLVEELSKRPYLRKFVQVGTSELYGSVDGPVTEDAPLCPSSPYAISKMAGDLHLESYWRVRGFPMNILRPSNAYGPGQLTYRILPRAVICALSNRKLPLEGGGQVRKSYLHATDVGQAIHLVADFAPPGATYNVGPENPSTIRDLVEMVATQLGLNFDSLVQIVPGRQGEDSVYWLDSTKIKRDLGWRQTITLEQGIADMIDWGRHYLPDLLKEPDTFELRA